MAILTFPITTGILEVEHKHNRTRVYEKVDKPKWEIYPDYWKDSWGDKPLLGTLYAFNEEDAVRKAYDRGLLPPNFTFGPLPIKVS